MTHLPTWDECIQKGGKATTSHSVSRNVPMPGAIKEKDYNEKKNFSWGGKLRMNQRSVKGRVRHPKWGGSRTSGV